MEKRRRKVLLTGLGLGILAIAGTAVWLWPQIVPGLSNPDGEPTFMGKPSSKWRVELRAELAAPQKEAQPVGHALFNGNAEAVPILIDLLNDEDVRVRQVSSQFLCAHFMGRPGPEAAPAVGPLTARLQDSDPLVRHWSVQALACLGPQARDAVPDILKLLKDPDEKIAWEATWALGNMGPEARATLPALRQARQDPRILVQKGAASALEKIEPAAMK